MRTGFSHVMVHQTIISSGFSCFPLLHERFTVPEYFRRPQNILRIMAPVASEPIKTDEAAAELAAMTAEEERLLSPFAAVVARLGFGGVLGFCAGYSIKQASKAVAVFVGSTVVFLQTLQYLGYIEVKWKKIQRDVMKSITSEGAETFSVKDVTYWMRRTMNVLTHQAPQAGGFAGGIYLGLGM